ncbi:MAG: DNA translocase FtsK, partial [Allorhizobium sp.]
MPASVTLPQPPDAVGARALTYKLRRELARQQAEQSAWEAAMAEGASPREIGPAPQSVQPAPLVQGMRSVLASTQAASVGANMRPTTEAHVPPHLQRSLAQQAEAARLAAQQAAPPARPPMVRNAFLRTPPVQAQPEPVQSPAPQAAIPSPSVQSAASGFAAWAQMTNPAPLPTEAAATVAPVVVEAEAQAARLPIAALLSDHIFFEAMIAPVEAPTEIDMARPATAQPAQQARKPSIAQKAPQIALQPVRTIPAAAPQAMSPIRAEVVRYRPEGVTVPPQTGPAAVAKPVFDATPGSVVALYREVAHREVSAASLTLTHTPIAVAEPVAPLTTSAPAATPISTTAAAPITTTQARQPLFRAQEALGEGEYELPYLDYLQMPPVQTGATMTAEALEQSAGLLESVLEDFGIKGEVIDVRPGPVVTLYEFEPAPGVKSSRVIGLSDDIARSMSALSARVAVVPGRNVIGIELPNPVRETVYLRELIETPDYAETRYKLPVCLGKTIGGEPVIAELAKMPHLLVAGTTGSGKSVAINTMILSLLYRFRPDECRLIMVDPKMLELS